MEVNITVLKFDVMSGINDQWRYWKSGSSIDQSMYQTLHKKWSFPLGFLRIWSHLLKKSLMENFVCCAMWDTIEVLTLILFSLNNLVQFEKKTWYAVGMQFWKSELNIFGRFVRMVRRILPFHFSSISYSWLLSVGSSIYYVHAIIQKTNFSYPLIRTPLTG